MIHSAVRLQRKVPTVRADIKSTDWTLPESDAAQQKENRLLSVFLQIHLSLDGGHKHASFPAAFTFGSENSSEISQTSEGVCYWVCLCAQLCMLSYMWAYVWPSHHVCRCVFDHMCDPVCVYRVCVGGCARACVYYHICVLSVHVWMYDNMFIITYVCINYCVHYYMCVFDHVCVCIITYMCVITSVCVNICLCE